MALNILKCNHLIALGLKGFHIDMTVTSVTDNDIKQLNHAGKASANTVRATDFQL